MEPLDPKVKRWVGVAERCALVVIFVLAGGWLGYMMGVQGNDARAAEFEKMLTRERADRLEEIKRLQETQTAALAAVSRVVERTARTAERAASAADTAAAKASTAAGTAATAATTANRVSRSAAPAAAVNRSVREANRQLGGGK